MSLRGPLQHYLLHKILPEHANPQLIPPSLNSVNNCCLVEGFFKLCSHPQGVLGQHKWSFWCFRKTTDYIFKFGWAYYFQTQFLSCLLLPNYILMLWWCIYSQVQIKDHYNLFCDLQIENCLLLLLFKIITMGKISGKRTAMTISTVSKANTLSYLFPHPHPSPPS